MFGRLIAVLLLVPSCERIFPLVPPPDGDTDAVALVGDEDGDEVLDDADNCPGIPNKNQADANDGGDGVGDVCDPREFNAGDTIASRYFFNNPSGDPEAWAPTTDWSFEAGFVRQVGPSGQLVSNETPDGNLVTVEVGFRIVTWGYASPANRISVTVDQAVVCALNDEAQNNGTTGLLVEVPGQVNPSSTSIPELPEGALTRMRLEVARGVGVAVCEVGQSVSQDDNAVSPGTFSIGALDDKIEINYVVVYTGS